MKISTVFISLVLFILFFLPAKKINAAGTVICYGDSSLLVLTGYTGSVQWQSSSNDTLWTNILSATSDSVMLHNQVTTMFYRALVSAGGCNPFNSDTILVKVNPQLFAHARVDRAICLGATVAVGDTIAGSGGSGVLIYSWLPAAGLSDDSIAHPTAHPAVTTTYTLTVTDGHGCTATDAITLSVGSACIKDSLVINEIDYDQVSTDTTEFVEIYNRSLSPINLMDIALVFINGGTTPGSEYLRVDLSSAGTLPAGGYLVVRSANVVVPSGTQSILFSNNANNIQNGSPDAVLIYNKSTGLIDDAFSYEGSITTATVVGLPAGSVNCVEAPALLSGVADSNTVVRSLVRMPNGTDTDHANSDWTITATPSPGGSN